MFKSKLTFFKAFKINVLNVAPTIKPIAEIRFLVLKINVSHVLQTTLAEIIKHVSRFIVIF